jgi:hypothetical protein
VLVPPAPYTPSCTPLRPCALLPTLSARAMIRMPAARRPTKRAGWSRCYLLVGVLTVVAAAAIFYGWLFRVLQRAQGGGSASGLVSPAEAGALLGQAAHTITDRLKWLKRCPKCECEGGDGGGGAGGGGEADDSPSALDAVNDHPPPMLPSHYGMVHGMEPWERPNLKVWDLHTIPTDEWYERAKKATDRCDLEVHGGLQGAENGMEDKVVWVTALFDLKRGGAGMGDFQRGMEEYYRRFQTVLDRGA